jgi:hypothetical protein
MVGYLEKHLALANKSHDYFIIVLFMQLQILLILLFLRLTTRRVDFILQTLFLSFIFI